MLVLNLEVKSDMFKAVISLSDLFLQVHSVKQSK